MYEQLFCLTSLTLRLASMTTCLVEDRFVENYDPTIENTFHKTIQFRKFSFALDIVDTAGMVITHGIGVTILNLPLGRICQLLQGCVSGGPWLCAGVLY